MEQVLKEELHELGYEHVEIMNRAVRTEGTWRDVYYLNLHLRCALAVLVELAAFEIRNEEDLYKQASKIDWTSLFDVSKTFSIKGAIFSKLFRHSKYPFLLVKDAIADQFRAKVGERPNVEVKSPQVVIDCYVNNQQVVLSLNTSGLPLFQRGYRQSTGDAPLNEVVAAGLIRMSGWDKKSTFFDPFCGSGTLLIEAALFATGIPSNIERRHYAFMNFKGFDRSEWEQIWNEANKSVKELPCKIVGADIDPQMVMKARRNCRAFFFGRHIEISNDAIVDVAIPNEAGVMISNPPYGERLSAAIDELYSEIGTTMKHRMPGWKCWIISSSENGMKSIGLKPDKKIRLFNGDLECSFRSFSIYEGSKKQSQAISE